MQKNIIKTPRNALLPITLCVNQNPLLQSSHLDIKDLLLEEKNNSKQELHREFSIFCVAFLLRSTTNKQKKYLHKIQNTKGTGFSYILLYMFIYVFHCNICSLHTHLIKPARCHLHRSASGFGL